MQPPVDLHDAVQDLSEAISRRLILLDVDWRVIAYSIHESTVDRSRLSHVLAHSDAWPTPTFTDGVFQTTIDGLGSVVLLSLSDPRQVVGAIMFVLEANEDAIPADQLAILRERAAQLGPLVSLRSLYAGQDRHLARQYLQDLVGTDPPRRRAAAEGLAAKGLIGVAKRYCAVAVGTRHREGEAGERASWAAVDATLSFVSRRSTASVVGTMLDGGSGILVFPRPVVVDRLSRILQRPDLRGSHAGIGPVVGSLEEIWASFEKAQRALRVSLSDLNDQNLVVEWESLGLDSLLVLLPLDQLRRSDLPAPLRLLFDARSADVLVRTLDAYLTAGGDAQATARTLMIHRSTLYYRLDRIRELTGSDLRDGRTRRELHTGIRMLNWRDCGVTRHPDAGGRISPQRRASHQGQDRHHPPHSGHGPGTDRVLGPTPDPAPTAGLAMGNGVEHPVQQPVSPTPRSSPDLNAPTAPRHERPSGTTRHPGRATTHARTAAHLGSRHTIEINFRPTADRWIPG